MEVKPRNDTQSFCSGKGMGQETDVQKLSKRVEQLEKTNRKLASQNSKLSKKVRKLDRSDDEKKLLKSLDAVCKIIPDIREAHEKLKSSASNSLENSEEKS